MTITQISAWIMLVCCGLWSGGILIFAVERTDLWRRMPLEQYAVDFRRSLFRVDPMMPILGVTAGAGATFFALNRSGAATALAWAGVGFIALVFLECGLTSRPLDMLSKRQPATAAPVSAFPTTMCWRVLNHF